MSALEVIVGAVVVFVVAPLVLVLLVAAWGGDPDEWHT